MRPSSLAILKVQGRDGPRVAKWPSKVAQLTVVGGLINNEYIIFFKEVILVYCEKTTDNQYMKIPQTLILSKCLEDLTVRLFLFLSHLF